MEGYIKVPRLLFEIPEFGGERFSKREAFIDLVQMASNKPTIVPIHGGKVQTERGQIAASRGFLAARWGWDKGRVRRYIDSLCENGLCIQEGGRITILTITGYDKYAGEPAPRTAKPAAQGDDKAGAVARLYALYPTKCPVSGRATGKSSKDKHKLEILLRTIPEEKLAEIIKRYIKESTEQNSYVKNFATFLNNLPDYGPQQADDGRKAASREDAIYEATHPSREEIARQFNSFFAPQYPMGPGESKDDYQERTKPFWERFYEAWIARRMEAVNNKY